MSKPKNTKIHVNKVQRKRARIATVIAIILSLLAVAVSILLLIDRNTEIQQKEVLNQSLVEMKNIVDKFERNIVNEKRFSRKPENTCSRVGVKYSNEYNCGSSFTIKIAKLNESQFRDLSQKLADLYRGNTNFTETISYPLETSNISKNISSVSGGKFRDTNQKCYVSSELDLVSELSIFSGGCHMVVGNQLFKAEN